MSTRGLKKWALLLTFWLSLHTAALRADLLGPYGTSPITFDVDANGLLSATGTEGGSGSLSLSGAGTRMFWYPQKAAFRAGSIVSIDLSSACTEWNDANIGQYSVAFGLSTIASGYGSTASGYYTRALGYESVAFGYVTEASGDGAMSIGVNTLASGRTSMAAGFGTTASGYFTTASGYWTTAQAYADFAIGRYNMGTGTTGSWVSTDPLFEVGNGTDSSHKSDALLLDKSGNLTVKTVTVTAPAGDIPMFGS